MTTIDVQNEPGFRHLLSAIEKGDVVTVTRGGAPIAQVTVGAQRLTAISAGAEVRRSE